MWRIFWATFAIVALAGVVAALMSVGLNRTEQAQCLKWQQEAREYSRLYFLTEWQAEQCEAHSIVIEAPVRVFFEDGTTQDFESIEEVRKYYK